MSEDLENLTVRRLNEKIDQVSGQVSGPPHRVSALDNATILRFQPQSCGMALIARRGVRQLRAARRPDLSEDQAR